MTTYRLLLLPGDGIGVETMAEVERVIAFLNKTAKGIKFETVTDLVGGASYDKHGVAITDAAMDKAQKADAVIFGAVGGPKWDGVPYAVRPEAGLLRLRKDPYFDYAQALLQIAVVLASISIITGGSALLVMSVVLAAAGILLGLNGFTLLFTVPMIG